MRTSRFHVLAAAGALSLGLAACGPDNDEVPPPQPTDMPTLPSPANPDTVPPGGTTAGPGDAPAIVPDAATQAPADEPVAGPVAGADRAFVAEAAASGLAEAEAGKLAAQKATNEQVKAFGAQLEKDHGEANNRLAALAQDKGITVPASVEGPMRERLDELATLSGAAFDRAFVDSVGVAMHEDAVGLFERQVQEGQDAEVRAFAEQTLGMLRSHLQTARDLGQALE